MVSIREDEVAIQTIVQSWKRSNREYKLSIIRKGHPPFRATTTTTATTTTSDMFDDHVCLCAHVYLR